MNLYHRLSHTTKWLTDHKPEGSNVIWAGHESQDDLLRGTVNYLDVDQSVIQAH